MKVICLALACALLATFVQADIYMHHPRGNNNRNCEVTQNRQNANRLFNSQNNDDGGYACPLDHYDSKLSTPRMYYYQGSILPIQWTNQHSCGFGNNDCQIVIQFACNDTFMSNTRDGYPTSSNDQATTQVTSTTYTQPNVGVNESLDFYNKCKKRFRNQGLYVADQGLINTNLVNPNANAMYTRQNPGATEYGLECQEERDYYPYWHPTPWRDIAIFTTQPGNCSYYQQESQNVKGKGECYDATSGAYLQYNTVQTCQANGGKWTTSAPWGIPAPDCLDTSTITVRDNHLGNVASTGQMAQYNWKVPSYIANEACVLRIRYNITTADTPWYLDSNNNGINSLIRDNPFGDWGHGYGLQIAFNTDQGGRTFQDRSYVFAIRARPPTVPSGATIYNVGVRGKRGNIVDVYPSVEYDFAPQTLTVYGTDYVHFQWTGSDYNPNRQPNSANGGPVYTGRQGSDRSNIVQLDKQGLNVPRQAKYNTLFMNSAGQPDMNTIFQMALLGQPVNGSDSTTSCQTPTQIATRLGTTTVDTDAVRTDKRNCGFLNSASVYFDMSPIQLKASGQFHYFCSRNNAFSNRSQKGIMTVVGGIFAGANSIAPSAAIVALVSVVVTLVANML